MQATYPQRAMELLRQFPDVDVSESVREISEEAFIVQRGKQLSRRSDSGVLGVVWMPDGSLPLVERSTSHPGWALPGGTVEPDESFRRGFVREIYEEVGVRVVNASVQLVSFERRTLVCPRLAQTLYVHMATFMADVRPGDQPFQTANATEEGLRVERFGLDSLPSEMIFADKEKIIHSAHARLRGQVQLVKQSRAA